MKDRIHVLVVDDDEADALLVREVLEDARRKNFVVSVASRYDDALEEVRRASHDVVLLDHNLGAKTGVDLLRAVDADALPPVVMLTGADPEKTDRDALSAGASDLVTKQEAVEVKGLLERAVLYALDRKRHRQALQESQERYAVAVSGSNDGIWDWKIQEGTLYGSKRFRELVDVQKDGPENLDMLAWRSRIYPPDLDLFDRDLNDHLSGKTPHFVNEHRIKGDHFLRWVRARGVALRDSEGTPRRLAGSLTDIHSEKLAQQQVLHAATHDQLTGIHNRTYLQQLLERHLEIARDNPAHSFSLIYVDLDRFKPLNDGLGHLVGDEIIFEAARRLTKAVGERGVVARHGGDEFVAVLETSDREARDVAESMCRAFQYPFSLSSGGSRAVTASVGVLHGRPDYPDHSALIRDADIAMYEAKQRGRDGVVVFDEDMREETLRRFALEEDLKGAISRGDLFPVYQPIVSLSDGSVVAFEALLRWNHPRYGHVPPPEFVSIAEETGLIVDLGDMVLRRVVDDLRSWPESDVSVSVNVSAMEFSDTDVVDRFRKATRGLAPGAVNVEITESAIVHNEQKVFKTLQELKSIGVHAHLDDFGTGFASVSHLVQLPLEGVKIDMSLVRKIDDPRYQAAVKAVVDLAHSLGMYTVVEGVETRQQRNIVTSLGADFAQGYLFSRPLTVDKAAEFIEKNAPKG